MLLNMAHRILAGVDTFSPDVLQIKRQDPNDKIVDVFVLMLLLKTSKPIMCYHGTN